MAHKIIRDPVYDYIAIDLARDGWLLDLLNTPAVQRLRHIHQLGVSFFTYPGATHTRLCHSLGVMHLMQQTLEHLQDHVGDDDSIRKPLLAAALVHDIGHGPFSHIFEGRLGPKHEEWTVKIIREEGSGVNTVLQREGILDEVCSLIEKDNFDLPYWQKSLVSSQLDVDRMDYLMRDSHFLGTGYGRFDWYRIINTMELSEHSRTKRMYPVWPEKAKYAIEEYIFARYYMYQSVYFHHCTRGYEMLLLAIWDRAKELKSDGKLPPAVQPLDEFLDDGTPGVDAYLRLRDCHVLTQLSEWSSADDSVLSALCRRFLNRQGYGAIEIRIREHPFTGYDLPEKEAIAKDYLSKNGYPVPEYALLHDKGQLGIYDPYHPEPDSAQQEPMTAIFLSPFREIAEVLTRLQAVTREKNPFFRYYCPKEHREKVKQILMSQ